MNPAFLRTLEDWTTHQDYLWFLAVLAWGAFLGAEIRKKDSGGAPANRWLIALAVFQIAGALVELVLLAQDLTVPYTKLDLAMGVAQAGGTGALIWGATAGWKWRRAWRGAAALLLIGLAAARYRWPVAAGLVLCLLQAIAVLAVMRRERRVSAAFGLLLVAQPIVATHGPWANAIGFGRHATDWSYFAIPAATILLASGAVLATSAWRRRLREIVPGTSGNALWRDLRRAVFVLIAWLVGGLALAFWYGRQAQRAFEANVLNRVNLAAFALDPDVLVSALDRDLEVTMTEIRLNTVNRPVNVVTIPETDEPVFVTLRERVKKLQDLNPDFAALAIWVQQGTRFICLRNQASPRGDDDTTHVLRRLKAADVERFAAGLAHVHGPTLEHLSEAILECWVPLRHPGNGRLLGWLSGLVYGTRWSVTFVQARLQIMALLAVGLGLWTVAVTSRLRREARDAAEQRATAAAAADRMKSAFLAKVSHELRTPIQSVLGYSELLASAPLGEPHRTWLGALRTHGDVMLRLVNDLIDLGALQSGAFQLDPAPVRLARVIDECVAGVRPTAQAKKLSLAVEVAPDLPVWVQTDAVRLRQVLLNLLANAVKFTPAGRVSLAVRALENEEVEFVIADTGPGIPPALRSRLFQPFARLDPAAAGGTGLGLALVQGICAAMGGSVRLADDGPGATFVVRCRLPGCPPPKAEKPATAAPAPFAGMQILVAEDNSLVRELLVSFLSGASAEVSIACDGPAALALAREYPPHVLLLDIGLPEMDGIAVAETLRREGAAFRIVGLSAHASAVDEARARAAGMDEFLTKPVSLSRLTEAILARREQDRPPVEDAVADRNLRARLVTQFARETPQVLAELRAAIDAADWPRVRHSAHYLKNSADVLGLDALQAACRELYLLPEPTDVAEARARMKAVETALPAELVVSENAE